MFNKVINGILMMLLSTSLGIISCRYDLLICAMFSLYMTIELFVITLNACIMELGIKRYIDYRTVLEDIKETTVIMIIAFIIMALAVKLSEFSTELCLVAIGISIIFIVIASYKLLKDNRSVD